MERRGELAERRPLNPDGTNPFPLPPQNLPRGLLGPEEPGIPFSLALITIRCRKWKITALARLG